MRTTFFVACLALSAMVPTTQLAAQSTQDKAIAQDIGGKLKSSGQLKDYRIGVKYKDGVAALSGTVTSRQQLVTAVRLTQGMPGVNHVVNNLTVAGDAQGAGNPQVATRASFTASGPQNLATRTSYQQPGNQPMGPGPQHGRGFNPQQMGPQQMGPQQMGPPHMGPQQMGMNQGRPMMPRQQMGPMGPRPQRPMNAQMQGPRGNMPRPMGQPPVQQAMGQQAMAQQAQMQQAMMAQQGPMGGQMGGPMGGPMGGGVSPAGCNCGPGGMGGYDGGMGGGMGGGYGDPAAMGSVPGGMGGAVNYDNAQMPGYAWPSYASYPNYAALTYPKQYSPSAWPYIGPFYPYPQVPLGWRKVCLEWDDGWWFLDFSDCGSNH